MAGIIVSQGISNSDPLISTGLGLPDESESFNSILLQTKAFTFPFS